MLRLTSENASVFGITYTGVMVFGRNWVTVLAMTKIVLSLILFFYIITTFEKSKDF